MGNKLIFHCLCCLMLCGCVTKFDDEENEGITGDDQTAFLAWEGETEKFTVNEEGGIRLNDPSGEAGTAYLTFPSTAVRKTRWEFGLKLSFNPSAKNYARFYLSASSETLPETSAGYYVQIGGVKDNVSFYRIEDGAAILLISGRELMKGDNSPELYVKVECDTNGHWTLWTRAEGESEYTEEGGKTDTRIQSSERCGIYCVYTKSRSDGFTFHHIKLSDDVADVVGNGEDDTEEQPDTSQGTGLPENVRGMLLFNEVMYDCASDGAEYVELYNPADTDVTLSSLLLFKMKSTGEVFSTTTLCAPVEGEPLTIPAKGYVCFTRYPDRLVEKHGVSGDNLIEVLKFPQLSNDGGYLAIATDEKFPRTVDTCRFIDWMHDGEKTKGVALEKKSPELPSLNANWRSSRDRTGGTPGMANTE